MRRLACAAFVSACLLSAGCDDGPKLVSVSGVVKLDGQPYKNAIVSFQPVATGNSLNAGMGSTGLTDENGKYTLTTIDGKRGAVVGPHKVRIQTKRDDPTAFVDPTVGSDDNPEGNGGKRKTGLVDPIPLDWYADTGGKDFAVPAGGTDKADVDIPPAKTGKKK
jgi:hypothetical protein